MDRNAMAGSSMWAAQSGIWFAQQLSPPSHVHNLSQYTVIHGPIDVRTFERAVGAAVAEVEMLRAYFVEGDGLVRQFADPALDWALKVMDLSGARDAEAEAMIWMRGDMWRPVDLSRAPLYESVLFKVAHDRYIWYKRVHHIIMDALSAPLFINRAAQIYNGLIADETPRFRAPVTIEMLAADDSSYRSSAQFADDREFWQGRLKDLGEPVSLSHQFVADDEVVVRRSSGTLSEAESAGIRDAASRLGATWPTMLIAAAAAYVHRLTGAEDIVLEMPVAGRTTTLHWRAPAMLSNVLPLRVRTHSGMSFQDLVSQTFDEVRDVLAHQRYRYEDVRRDLGLLLGQQLSGVEINVMPFRQNIRFGGSRASIHTLANGLPGDLAIAVGGQPREGELLLDVDGNARRHDMEDLAAHRDMFAGFLRGIVADPGRAVGRLDVLRDSDRKLLERGWSEARRPVPDRAFSELFEEQVRRTPDGSALVDGKSRWSYVELNARVNRLAHLLRDRGLGPERFMVSALPRSVDVVVAFLAALKVGAVYVPVDPDHPVHRNSAVLESVRPDLVLAACGRTEGLPPLDSSSLLLLDAPETVEALDAAPDTDPPGPDVGSLQRLTYAIFTSGSTGKPKGALIVQSGMVNHLLAKVEDLALAESDRVAFNAPLTFDVSVWQMLSAFLVGGSVHVLSEEAVHDGLRLFEEVDDQETTVLEVVPSLMGAVLDAFDDGFPAPRLSGLRWFVVNGEVLPADLCRRWYARFPAASIVNAYGLTECSDDNTHAFLGPADVEHDRRLPVGRALRNNRLYVLGADLAPVPVGVAGDLFIAGAGVGRGYLHDPARTAERYVADLFSTEPGARMYRTGDRVRLRPDGQLDFLGRRDHQVKVRGNRIELGEVEAALRGVQGVVGAAVAVHGDSGKQRIVGYLVGEATPEKVRHALASVLPDYMIPAAFVVLDRLPLNSNGKVDRKALPEPDLGALVTGGTPRTERERRLAELFAEVLGLPSVGVDDNFFDLGGDSIVAIQLVSRARNAGLSFSARDVFEQRNVAALAAVAERHGAAGAVTAEPREAAVGEVRPTPIIEWLRERGGPVEGFHQFVLLNTPPAVDGAALGRALQALVDHHDVLRMRLVGDGSRGEWSPVVDPSGNGPAGGHLRRVAIAEMDERAIRVTVENELAAARARLDPATGYMLQGVWFDGGPHLPGRLLLVVHHLVVDGVSWRILLPDLVRSYKALAAGGEPVLTPVVTSFRGWARLQSQAAAERESELPIWLDMLGDSGARLWRRPLDRRLDVARTAGSLRTVLEADTTAAILDEVPAAFHARVEDVLLTALALAVGRRERGPLIVDLEHHGREDVIEGADVSATVGWFTSLHPVRLDIGTVDWARTSVGGQDVGTALRRVKEGLRQIPDNGIGYGMLRYLNPGTRQKLSGYEEPEIGFNYLGRLAGVLEPGWEPAAEAGGTGGGGDPAMPLAHLLEIDVFVDAGESGPELVALWTWAGDVLSEREVADLARDWSDALCALVAHTASEGAGGYTPSDLPLVDLSQEEIDALEAEVGSGRGATR